MAFIPLIGPFLTLGSYPRYQIVVYPSQRSTPTVLDCNGSRTGVSTIVWVDETLQLAGVGMIAAALVLRNWSPAVQTQVGRLEIIPGAPATPLGMSVRVTEF